MAAEEGLEGRLWARGLPRPGDVLTERCGTEHRASAQNVPIQRPSRPHEFTTPGLPSTRTYPDATVRIRSNPGVNAKSRDHR